MDLSEAFEITRSLPHGHVAAVLGTARALGIEELIDPAPSRQRDLVMRDAGGPGDRARLQAGHRARAAHRDRDQLAGPGARGVGCDEDDLYAAMDWALARKDAIENALAARHLANGTLVLYDVSSAAFEGRTCPLGAIGHARDGVKGRLQIVYGLLCSPAGIPIAIEVFEGNTADPKTLAAQITKLKTRFGLARVCLVGRSGHAHQRPHPRRATPRAAGLDQRAARPADQSPRRGRCAAAVAVRRRRTSSRSTSPDFPGERLVCCHNPVLAAERARKRGELLAATEKDLAPIAAATRREQRPLRGKDNIALRVGKVINHYKMAKHFTLEITDESFTFTRNTEAIAAEAALDGIYVLRTSLPADTLAHDDVVSALQGTRRRRTVLPHPQQRTRRAAHPAPAGRPGTRPHVPAHAVLLHQLAHETRPGPNPVPATTTNPPPPPNAPTPSPPPNAPMTPWPKPRVNAPPTTPRCTASPACSPTWPPSAPTRSSPPTTCQHSP